MRISDWSSDVCSSDLQRGKLAVLAEGLAGIARRGTHAGQQQRGGNPQLRPALLDALGSHLQVQVARLRTDLQIRQHVIVEQRRSEEHTSELQSLMRISYAVFCLKHKKIELYTHHTRDRPNKRHILV